MAPAASITVVCPRRPAHGAAIVRLVHVAPVARPRTQAQSAHVALRANLLIPPVPAVPWEGPHTRAHTHTCTHARAPANAQTHTRTRKHHRTARENTQLAVNAESRARAQIRTAHVCSRAHGRYRRGGSARTSAVETVVESLPIACVHARTDAIVRNRAMRWRTGTRNSRHGATAHHISPYMPADLRTTKRAHVHMYPSTDQHILRTHPRLRRCVCASRGDARERMQGGGGGMDLGASAGTHGHAQLSRAAPRGRLVATRERTAEPRRHPSLVRRRLLPRQPRASARGRSGKRPQCESALVGNRR
jgi:hypothetical protein